MASETDIVNQGLLLLGASAITDLTTGQSANAEKARLIYADTMDELTSQYPWKFALHRTQLTTPSAPAFGRARAFTLPNDYLLALAPYPESNFEELDWIIEGGALYTDDSDPLDFRYIRQITDTTAMDVLYRKALSAKLAMELAEAITQSTTKLRQVAAIFEDRIKEARRKNAFEAANHLPARDSWISARDRGRDNTRRWL